VGVFAHRVEDAAMLAEALYGYDARDPATSPVPAPRLLQTALSEPPVTPSIAFVRQPCWDEADDDSHDAFSELVEALGEVCVEVDLPPPFAEAVRLRECVNRAEMAKAFHRYEQRGRERLSPELCAALDDGKRILARDYLAARAWPAVLNVGLDEIFDRFDAIVTPAAPGAAPRGLESTGSSIFNALWTFCGTPAVTVPLLQAGNGLPIGVQIVQRRGDDARLLRTARWLVRRLSSDD
jgi:aspartyl-tRNA(Asn)/glutamyl-tRNA(Gln) amidotransferase subunit A